MKRIIIFGIIAALLLGICQVSCAEDNRQAISFRGIPWGSSMEAVLKSLEEDPGVNFDSTNPFMDVERIDDHSHEEGAEGITIPMLINGFGTQKTPVAGYYATNITLYFVPKITDDGQSYSLQEGDEKFWKAYYNIYKPQDISAEEFVADLVAKLSSLYGEPDIVSENNIVGKTVTHYSWQDDQGHILLCNQFGKHLILEYRCADINTITDVQRIVQITEEANQMQEQEEEKEQDEDSTVDVVGL